MKAKLVLEKARALVAEIQVLQHDDEAAHSREDALHQFVLKEIKKGTLTGKNARIAAEIALSTQKLPFSRWCA